MAIAFKGKARASYIIVCALQLTLPTIDSDVVGAPKSIQQVLQYVTFTDDYSRYTNVHDNSGLLP